MRAFFLFLYAPLSYPCYGVVFPATLDQFVPSFRETIEREARSPTRQMTPHTEPFFEQVFKRGRSAPLLFFEQVFKRGRSAPLLNVSLKEYGTVECLQSALGRLPTTVITLDLSNNRIKDIAPFVPSLCRLTNLQNLSFQNNFLDSLGQVPALLSALPVLQKIDFRENTLRSLEHETLRQVTGSHKTFRCLSLGGNFLSEDVVRTSSRYGCFEIVEDQRSSVPSGWDFPAPFPSVLENSIAADCLKRYKQDPQSQSGRGELVVAVDLEHPEACYIHSRNLQGVPGPIITERDPVTVQKILDLQRKAAEGGYLEAQYAMALWCKAQKSNGDDRVRTNMLVWFKHAARQGHKESWHALGEAYETHGWVGERGRLDIFAAFCYDQAARMGYKPSQRALAILLENGISLPKDLKQALSNHLAAACQGSVTSRYNAARLYGVLRQNWQDAVESLWWTCQATPEDNPNPNALFLLARFYQRGDVLPANPKYATLILKGIAVHHTGAKLFLALHEGGRGAVLPSTLPAEIKDRYATAQGHLAQKLKNGTKVGPYELTKDFEAAVKKAQEISQEHSQDPLQINVDYLWADPYLNDYNRDIHADISDEDATQVTFEDFFARIALDMPNADSFPRNEPSDLQQAEMEKVRRIAESIALSSRGREGDALLTRKRFIRLFKDQYAGQDTPQTRGAFGMLLAQNEWRCRDGLDIFLDEMEWTLSQKRSLPVGIPLGHRISRVLNQYREGFLARYMVPFADDEQNVTNRGLLHQRMRLPLGLVGEAHQLLYPQHHAQHQDSFFAPPYVMQVFLEGTTDPSSQGIVNDTTAYTPGFMVSLLKQAREAKLFLADSAEGPQCALQTFARHSPTFQAAFDEAFADLNANAFFDPMDPKIFTDRFYEELLVVHGYLKRPSV